MTPDGRRDSPLNRAAARRLGLGLTFEPPEAKAAILRRLRQDGFLPDPATHEAMLILSGRPGGAAPLLAEDLVAEEGELRRRIEMFAAEFFSVPIPERRFRWQTLANDCAGREVLEDRLRELTSGLNADLNSLRGRSPAVMRLGEDLFTLFPLRPAQRATLSRELACRFRVDPSFTDRERTCALRELLRWHLDVAALSHGYLAQVSRQREPLEKVRRRARTASRLDGNVEERPRSLLFLAGVLGMIFSALGSVMRSTATNTSFSPPPVPIQQPTFPFPVPAKTKAASSDFVKAFHNDFKFPLRRELAKFDKTLSEDEIQQIVNKLPQRPELAQSGLARAILFGQWTQTDYDRCVAAIVKGLKERETGLTESQVEAVARGSVPKPSAPREL